ncbi:MAG: hypothetical protein CENE_01193 [Candidatus Celerinatantimonas neptuna]|nr:MAG: hypothetical protein CENE_01193 [Candidatus Celerinatantimonas neptuna]
MQLTNSTPYSFRASTINEKLIVFILFALFIARMLSLPALHLALYYDEAYYHFWALSPAFGYYSKPPVVAWLIALTTGLFGHTPEWSVRISAPLLYAGAAYFVYRMGCELSSKATGLLAALIFYSSPLVTFNSLFITTDAPLLFFWALAGWLFLKALYSNRLIWWILCGLASGMGLMSKYTMIVIFIGAAIYLIFQKERRVSLLGVSIATGLIVLLYLPNLIWNSQHDFISFVHTAHISHLSHRLFHPGKFFGFLGGQFLVFGPVAMWLWLKYVWKKRRDHVWLFLLSISLPLFVLMCIQAFLAKANANWAAPVYLGASLMVALILIQQNSMKLASWVVGVNIMLAVILFSYPTIQKILHIEPTRHNTPYARVLGWREVMENIKREYPQVSHMVLLSGSRKLLSYGNYYLSQWKSGRSVPVVSFNPGKRIEDQYDLLYDLSHSKFKHFLFISEGPRNFKGCFKSSRLLGKVVGPVYPTLKRVVYLYQVSGFNGYEYCHKTYQ